MALHPLLRDRGRRRISGQLVADLLGVTRQAAYQTPQADWPLWLRKRLRMAMQAPLRAWGRHGVAGPVAAAALNQARTKVMHGLWTRLKGLDVSLADLAWLLGVRHLPGDVLTTLLSRAFKALNESLIADVAKLATKAKALARPVVAWMVRRIIDARMPGTGRVMHPRTRASLDRWWTRGRPGELDWLDAV